MNAKVSSPISFIFLCLASLLIVSCGGAPEDPNSTGEGGNSANVINIQDIPTLLSLSIEPVPGPLDFDGIEVTMTATAGGLLGNPVTRDLTVEFVSPEMGVFNQDFCIIESNSESCSVTWVSAGARPLDGEISIVAIAAGAEQFGDVNGNELYDEGEPIEIDYSEPFADENDNGIIDPGEFFADVNGNGEFDLGNGVWDGPCGFRAGDCSGSSQAVIFRINNLTLCPMEEPAVESLVNGFDENGEIITEENSLGEDVPVLFIAEGNIRVRAADCAPLYN